MSRQYCSFCGKTDYEVAALIAGPACAFICDECVDLCVDIVAKKRSDIAHAGMGRCAGCKPAPLAVPA